MLAQLGVLGLTKSHKPVSSSTITRWLKVLLGKAEVNTEIFKAHSTRSASTSAAAAAGVTTGDILKAADWSSEAVFQKFNHKPSASSQFGLVVLSSNSCHTEHTLIWRLSLLKYNYRMAQPTQWVPAILNYTRKVKSNISMSHPIPPLMTRCVCLDCLGLTTKKTELEVGKISFYGQGDARAHCHQITYCPPLGQNLERNPG